MKTFFAYFLMAMILFAKPASDDKKPIMIFVETQHCQWCHKMREEIFNNPNKLAKLKERYYVVLISKESGDLPLFVDVKYFPTTFIYSQDGSELIDSLIGYRTKEKFFKFFDTSYDIEDDDF